MTTHDAVRPLLLLEINEVPWRLVDHALASGRFPAVARFFACAATYTTVSRDQGELSPWITWPSLHRGLNNTEHGIKHLGQDVATFKGTPIWSEYRHRGLPIGVFGSLQSWPPVEPGPGGFYIPDTFAHDERCIPAFVEPLQRFNLRLVRRNGLVVRDERPPLREALEIVPALLRGRVSPRTYARVARQLVTERLDRTRLAQRPIFQTLLFWDVFKSLYAKHPPTFASFFSNHVAGVMHRYWDEVFPEDFPERAPGTPRPHAATMDFALAVMEEILGDALVMAARDPRLIVAFATSMGQGAVHRDYHQGFDLAIADTAALMRAFEVPASSYSPLIAMVPQVAVEITDEAMRAKTRSALEAARTVSGAHLLTVDEVGTGLSITIHTPSRGDADAGGFERADGAARRRIGWSEAGIVRHEIDAGTGYHVPEGVLAVLGQGIAPSAARGPLEATAVKGMLMELTGLSGVGTPADRAERTVKPATTHVS